MSYIIIAGSFESEALQVPQPFVLLQYLLLQQQQQHVCFVRKVACFQVSLHVRLSSINHQLSHIYNRQRADQLSRNFSGKQWSDECMVSALEPVKSGMSVLRAAKLYDVPKSTLRDRVKGRVK